MPTIDLPQGPLHYRHAGPPESSEPPVVLLHGLLVDAELWTGTAAALAERGVRSYALDLPLGAHRRALHSDADVSPRGVAHLVLDFIAALGLGEVTLVGNDTGGALCQMIVDTDPAAVAHLVLINCDAFDQFPPAPFDLLVRAGRSPHRLHVMMALMRSRRIRHSALGYGPLARHLDPAMTARWAAAGADSGVRRDAARFMAAIDPGELLEVSERLHRYTGPVTLLWGAADPFFTLALGRRLAGLFPNARMLEIPNGRTLWPLDDPQRAAAEIYAAAQTRL